MTKVVAALVLFLAGTISSMAGHFHDAARDGDLETVRALLGDGVELDGSSRQWRDPADPRDPGKVRPTVIELG